MKSIIQDYEAEPWCFECGSPYNLQEHHCIEGRGRRALSEKYGLKILLCGMGGCHDKAHNGDSQLLEKYQEIGQKAFMEHYKKTVDEFRAVFGISFL